MGLQPKLMINYAIFGVWNHLPRCPPFHQDNPCQVLLLLSYYSGIFIKTSIFLAFFSIFWNFCLFLISKSIFDLFVTKNQAILTSVNFFTLILIITNGKGKKNEKISKSILLYSLQNKYF